MRASGMLTFVIHVRAKLGHSAEMAALLDDFCWQVREKEPGVIYFDFAHGVEDPDTFVVVEVYRDAAARQAHGETPWLKDSMARAAHLTAGHPEVREYIRNAG